LEPKKTTASAVLVIDDERKLSALMTRILELEGFQVFQAPNGKEGLKTLMQENILVVISDVKLPDVYGVDLVRTIKEKKPYVEIINLTAYGTIADGVKAMQNGAFNYIIKGDDNDRIIPLLHQAFQKAQVQLSKFNLEKNANSKYGFSQIIGHSRQLADAVSLARKVAVTDTTVLLLGETGTGKEVFASAIHHDSQRKLMSFVAVNCSSFTGELLESELFGYKAGAFTGALKDKKGLFEEAHYGTIFLDEIGEISQELQAKLLRVLENKSFIKLGDTQTTKVNVRILAATNRNLGEQVAAGHFRADLFYRLSVFTITLPSLNDRKNDVEILAKHFFQEFKAIINNRLRKIDPEFIDRLSKHHWKGNIRELKNVMERAVILADTDTLTPDLLPPEFIYGNNAIHTLELANIEKQHIYKVLEHTGGNKTEAARLLGIGLTTLYRKLDEYQLN